MVSIQPHSFDRYFNALKPDITNEHSYEDEDVDNYSSVTKSISSRNPWFNEFWERRFGCSLTSSSACAKHQLNETNWDSKLQFIVDATYVFAQALHIYFNCTSSICYNTSLQDINGTKLFQLILGEEFLSKFFFSSLSADCQIDLVI